MVKVTIGNALYVPAGLMVPKLAVMLFHLSSEQSAQVGNITIVTSIPSVPQVSTCTLEQRVGKIADRRKGVKREVAKDVPQPMPILFSTQQPKK